MKPIATYSFVPWLRQGLANSITAADGDQSVKTRASTHVELTLAGDPLGGGAELTQTVTQDVALFGPGDIIGIDSRAIVRTEPRSWVTNFEANYLPAVEFYDEDFPWRYTPATTDPTQLRLRPWIALVVLKESEFEEGKNIANRPLPFITVADPSVFPPAAQLWAWAHVHFNENLAGNERVSPDMNAVLARVQAILSKNPDLAYSRIVCPRRLDDNTGYHAFVVPVFETGRLAGLGQKPDAVPAPPLYATLSAWENYTGRPESANYPIYYRWYFRTGSHGDFEYLVRLLQPRPVDKRVGTRDIDVQNPGSNIPGITDPALGGIVRLGGALRVPRKSLGKADLDEAQKYENWFAPYPHNFQKALAAFINLPDDYAAKSASAANATSGLGPGVDNDPDPLITAPLYGRWPALTQRLLAKRDGTPATPNDNWVHQLNLDPQYRVPANFGTDVVETNAELYMDSAWQQIGDVLEANRRIRRLQLAKEVSWRWHLRHLTTLASANAERAYAVSAPVARRVLVNGATVQSLQGASLAPPVFTSTAMRRILRPGARLMRSLPFDATATPANLIARVNAGEVSAAPPKVVPPGVPTLNGIASAAAPPGAPQWLLDLLYRYRWLPAAVLAVGIFLAILCFALLPVIGIIVGLAIAAGAYLVFRLLRRWQVADAPPEAIREENQTPAAVDQFPKSPDFVIAEPGSNVRPTTGATDSAVAVRFKSALRDSFSLLAASKDVAARPAPIALNLSQLTTTFVKAVDPQVTIPRRGLSMIALPPDILGLIGDTFDEVMNYPKIDLPMYEPLKVPIENFLPNINLIPTNSITLVETNQKFIESYMVGLNHEFARKLLWREYPTDQRGSYFRQFWDVRSFFNSENLDDQALKEKLYDIPELHRWPRTSNLGDHNNRATPGEVGEEAVLVIRGELLKKYPNAVIFAQHALWFKDTNGIVDTTQPRELDEPTGDAEAANPPRSKMRFPLYEAKADPDIYFFGFDLTISEARGGTTENDDAGWFFVIKERPGEPRFGLELNGSDGQKTFDDLTWDYALPGNAPGQFLPADSLSSVALAPLAIDPPENQLEQQNDDKQVDSAPVSAARWAYLLFRAPVMVAVHADQMLAKP